MTLTRADFIWKAAYDLVGNTNGALFISGDPSYENIVWDTKIYTGTIPTKEEVETKAQALLDGDIKSAQTEMKDSLWYRQTTNRAERLIEKLGKSI